MMSPGRRSVPKLPVLVVAALVAAAACMTAWQALVAHHGSLERQLLDFCQSRHVGRPIADVARAAAQAGLRASGGSAGAENRQLIAYELPPAWLPVASVCTLRLNAGRLDTGRLDAGTVASVSFDPWYH